MITIDELKAKLGGMKTAVEDVYKRQPISGTQAKTTRVSGMLD